MFWHYRVPDHLVGFAEKSSIDGGIKSPTPAVLYGCARIRQRHYKHRQQHVLKHMASADLDKHDGDMAIDTRRADRFAVPMRGKKKPL